LETNWDKVSQPKNSLSFLGVQIDCVRRTLSLPEDTLVEVKQLLKKWLLKKDFARKTYRNL
jgi:hypothetical protein